MKDALLNFLVSLATAVLVLFILGPTMMRLNGLEPTSPTVMTAAESAGANGAGPAAGSAMAIDTATPTGGATGPAQRAEHELTAPNLTGMTVRVARDRWRDHGIIIIEDGEQVDATSAPGTILEQNPSAGASLAQKEIRVVVARAPELVSVPSVVGDELDAARKTLVDAGFEVPPQTVETSTEKGGTVIRQDPDPGGKTEPGSIVRLVVAAELIEVPKLKGKSITKATAILVEAGLVVGKITLREDPELSGRRVLSHSPDAGSQVEPGTVVDVVIVAPD